jgi:alanine racemase
MQEAMAGRTVAEIDLAALRYNTRQVRSLLGDGTEILAIVKADAYGHGAVPIGRHLEAEGIGCFGVATLEEGSALRESGLSSPILILAGVFPEDLASAVGKKLTPVIQDLDAARAVDEAAQRLGRRIPIHLKIDTGMSRLGIPWREWEAALKSLQRLGHLEVEGLISHFSNAESDRPSDRDFTEEQILRFRTCLEQSRKAGLEPRYIHMANSAAISLWERSRFNLVRPGLMLYGIHPSATARQKISLHPVLQWKTRILSLRRVPAGDPVSYGRTYVCRRDSHIATLAVGYADGYGRRLSNRGEVLVRGKRARITGIVCMDLTMVDVTDVPGVETGDEVVLLGRQESEEITVCEMADWMETISYEVLCGIGKRVHRVYLDHEDRAGTC